MKQIFITLFSALLIANMTACKDDDDKFKGNESPIYINGQDRTNKAETVETQQLQTVHEILAAGFVYLGWELPDDWHCGDLYGRWGDMDCDEMYRTNIDTINDRLVMEAANVIENGGIYQYGGVFLKGRNFELHHLYKDENGIYTIPGPTLGYIPNSVIREAQKDILDMWKAGDISAIYERFQQAFYFTPCTAEEFKAIKEDIDWEHEYDDLKAEHEHTHEIRW